MVRLVSMAAFATTRLSSLVEHCIASTTTLAGEPEESLRAWFAHLFAELVWALEEDNPEHFSMSSGFASGAAAHRMVRILNMFVDGVIAQGVEAAASREPPRDPGSTHGSGLMGIELANATSVMRASVEALRSGGVGINSKTFDLLELAVERVEELSRSLITRSLSPG